MKTIFKVLIGVGVLILLILFLGPLMYFGSIDASNLLPNNCVTSAEFECETFSVSEDSFTLFLRNNLANTIRITSVNGVENCVLPESSISADSAFEITCSYVQENGRVNEQFGIVYSALGDPFDKEVNGQLNART
jgi:hypothetical protein